MNYLQTIEYLYSRLPMFSRIGAAAYKKDLHNTLALCDHLGNPQNRFRSVHVAGTNGKGSTSHMLAAIFQACGYKTGLYTSPHLRDFRERIRINGKEVDKEFVVGFVEKTKEITEAISPSFFELTVAMAFEWFAEQQVDVAIIETGLGGRFDSTNVILPELSVITNIGFDHMNLLGNTLPEIAAEKAGIIKPGVPAVVGRYLPETQAVFMRQAAGNASPLYFASEVFSVDAIAHSEGMLECRVTDNASGNQRRYLLDLAGHYQAYNLVTVLCALRVLAEKGFVFNEQKVQAALQSVITLTGLHGRWEKLAASPDIFLDVAHNADGIEQVVRQLAFREDVHLVFGMVRDKDVDAVLRLLPARFSYYFTEAQIPRALPALELQQRASEHGLQGRTFSRVNDALDAARSAAEESHTIVVCGSVFLVGEVDVDALKRKGND